MSDTGPTGPTGGGNDRPGRGRVVVAVIVVALAAVAAVAVVLTRRPDPQHATTAPTTTTAPATQPQTAPATRAAPVKAAAKPRGPATRYFDVVQANYPRMPDTQPLAVPLDLQQAARFVFKEPVYLSPRGDLWVTRADAPPTEAVLARAAKEQSDQLMLTVREQVVFAHWMPRETGPWTFNLVARRPGGGYELVTQGGRQPIGTPGRRYRWERALDWNERVVVATDTGVSVFEWEPQVRELHYELAAAAPNQSEPQFLLDWQGVLAWMPWERGKTGGRGAARFVEGKWTPLGPDQGWPEKLMHLVPLYDGNVVQLVAGEGDTVTVAMASLEQVQINEAEVTRLVEALSDPDEQKRKDAYQELTRFGPSLGPVLERLMKDEAPEAQARLKQLLKTQLEPTLGGMTILGDQLRLAARLNDGGIVFYAEAGVMTPGPGDNDTPVFHTPAWLSIRPGQAATLLEPPLTTDMAPERSRIYAFRNDWVVTNDARGPQRFVGNGFEPLLRKADLAEGFAEPVGVDVRNRWLFRKPATREVQPAGPAAPEQASGPATTEPATTGAGKPATTTTAPADDSPLGPTLIVDPTLPDPTPRLPVWVYATADLVGWDKDDWPVVKKGGAWVLGEKGWRALKSKEKMFSKPEEVPSVADVAPPPAAVLAAATAAISATGPVTTLPAPHPTSAPATSRPVVATTTPATGPAAGATLAAASASAGGEVEDLGPPLLVDQDANRYYDGRSTLRVRSRDGRRVDWPLPPTATGEGISGKVYLVRAHDGLLFLFNRAGRVVRIRPTPDAGPDEPYTVDATFTRNVPNADSITRVWLDPAGRIIMAYGTKLAIMFPRGYVPTAITLLVPTGIGDDEP